MSLSPLEEGEQRRIGTVEFISPSEIKIILDIDAPSSTALNTGNPRSFPRLNGYVLIPSDEGFVVGQIEWLGIERSPFPKRKGLQDYGLVDLPYPLRKICLNPVGTLICSDSSGGEVAGTSKAPKHWFRRGVYSFPTVGDPAILPTDEQLRNIVESGENRNVLIGHAPLAGNAEVKVDPDRLFGRHLAVLGNTGSGKSCTVAGLIRWSLEAASSHTDHEPNARFIILDPNGEYAGVFEGEHTKTRVYRGDDEESQLEVPLWFWNSDEWCSFMQASGKSQRPLLRRALRETRSGIDPLAEQTQEKFKEQTLRRYLSSQAITIRKDLRSNAIKLEESKFGFRLKAIKEDLAQRIDAVAAVSSEISGIIGSIEATLSATLNTFTDKSGKAVEYYRAFTEKQVNDVLEAFHMAISKLGGIVYDEGPNENTPIRFDGATLADHLEILAEQEGVSQFLDTLVIRVRTMLADTKMRRIVGTSKDYALSTWLENYVGSDQATNGTITIVDLSLVPTEIIHIVTAVIARMVFEALQRYRMLHAEGKTLPTALVMEEAHTFIRRYRDDSEDVSSAAACCRVFERIAREGRKFGLGLVLSSQRPSELSPTVLSQCNTFLLHRITNDKDQEAVGRLLPDHLRGILQELPVLPSRHAFLLGWASELPVLTQIRELPFKQQPQSQDPQFWAVWTGKDVEGKPVERRVDWKAIAENWQTGVSSPEDKLSGVGNEKQTELGEDDKCPLERDL
jgi:DNA helicase HerA-like ATPase